jgi:hypothetical protein
MTLSFSQGLAIGLQEESSSLLSIFIAVILHKAVMAFSLGENSTSSNIFKIICTYSIKASSRKL